MVRSVRLFLCILRASLEMAVLASEIYLKVAATVLLVRPPEMAVLQARRERRCRRRGSLKLLTSPEMASGDDR